MQTGKRIAVAGATGRVGRHIVDVLKERGHDAVAISRSGGVDLTTGEGLSRALGGVEIVIDAATGSSPDQQAATGYFTTASRNLQEIGESAGVRRIVVVSIIGIDRITSGYAAAKRVHEQALLAGPIPVQILRASQFHEFVGALVSWGRRTGDVLQVQQMRTQLVASRTVAEVLVDLAVAPELRGGPIPEIAGPRAEELVAMARLLMAHRRESVQIEGVIDPANPDGERIAQGAMLPGPHAMLAGPTFEAWLAGTPRA